MSQIDHPSTFMKIIKRRIRTVSTANNEKRQVLPSKTFGLVLWTVLKYLDMIMKNIMENLALSIYLIQISKNHT
jgi:hypothetical protein